MLRVRQLATAAALKPLRVPATHPAVPDQMLRVMAPGANPASRTAPEAGTLCPRWTMNRALPAAARETAQVAGYRVQGKVVRDPVPAARMAAVSTPVSVYLDYRDPSVCREAYPQFKGFPVYRGYQDCQDCPAMVRAIARPVAVAMVKPLASQMAATAGFRAVTVPSPPASKWRFSTQN